MIDVKHYPEQQRALERRGRWVAAGALLGLLAAYAVVGTLDHADALRVEQLQKAHAKAHVAARREAFDAGFAEGARSVACVGLRLDARTGEPVK
jgi:hypothetical protein